MAATSARWLALIVVTASAAAAPLDGTAPLAPDPDEKGLTARPADPSPLIAQLGDANWAVRDRAMQGLIAMGAAARDALRRAARSRDAEVRWRASYALSRPEFGFAARGPDRARLLYRSAATARRQAGNEGDARLLYQAVVESHPKTRWATAARERLAELEPDPQPEANVSDEAVARLVRQLASPDWALRQRASWQLARLGNRSKAALARAAEGADREVAWRARRLFERIDLAESGTRSRADASRRSARVGMLARLFGDEVQPNRPTDLDSLVRALSSADPGDVAHAREVVLNLGTDAVPALLRGLEGCDEVAGVEIMDLLREITGEKLGFAPARWLAWWRQLRKRGRP